MVAFSTFAVAALSTPPAVADTASVTGSKSVSVGTVPGTPSEASDFTKLRKSTPQHAVGSDSKAADVTSSKDDADAITSDNSTCDALDAPANNPAPVTVRIPSSSTVETSNTLYSRPNTTPAVEKFASGGSLSKASGAFLDEYQGPGNSTGASAHSLVGDDGGVPAAPTGLTATAAASSATLTWNADTAPAAFSYNIYVSADPTAPASSFTFAGTTTASTFVVNGLVNGSTYAFYVIPFNNAGFGGLSNIATATIGMTPPVIVSAVPGDGSVTVTWDAEGGFGALSYDLFEGTNASGPFTLVANVAENGSSTYSYNDQGLANGASYYFYVVAFDNAGASPASQIVSAPVGLPAPTGLTASTDNGLVTLNWTASAAPGATYYQVYESTDPNQSAGSFSNIATVYGTTFSQMGLSLGTQYSYYLIPVNDGGPGVQSATAIAVPGLPAPTNLTATAGTSSVTLNWTASAAPGASYYAVYESSDPAASAGSFNLIGDAYGTTFTQNGLASGSTYSFYLIPYDNGGTGTKSATVSATPGGTTLMNLSASAGNGSVTLLWTPLPSTGRYNIYKSTDGVNFGYIDWTGNDTYTNGGCGNGQTYYYYIIPQGGPYDGVQSETVSAFVQCAPPTNLSAVPGNGNITLTWTASTSPGVNRYNIYRSTDGVNFGYIDWTGNTSYTNGGLTNGQTYYYHLDASNAGGAGPDSATVSALVQCAPPTNLSAAPGNGSITLTWTASISPGVGRYNIYRSTDGVNFGYIDWTGNTSYTNGGLSNGQVYYYYINAQNSGGVGPVCAPVSATPTIPPPTDLTATPGNGQITLNWTASAGQGVGRYNIFRSTDGVNFGYIDWTGGTSYTNGGLSNGQIYYYYLVPVNAGGNGTPTSVVSATPTIPPPTDLTLTPGNGSMTLTWTASAGQGVGRYNIFRSTDGVNFGYIDWTGGTSYTNGGLSNGQVYYYYLVPVNAGGNGTPSAVESALVSLPAPTGLTATMASNGQVTLNWTASGYPGCSRYNIYWSQDNVNFGYLDWTGNTSYVQGGLNPNNTYFYYLIPVNNGGNGYQSATASTAVGIPPPTNLTATPGLDFITLNWTASGAPGATSYDVYGSTDGVNFTQLDSTSGTTYTQSGLTTEVTYYYYVVPVGAEAGTPSQTVSATPLLPAPDAPIGLTATPGDGAIALGWNASTNADGYYIFQSTDDVNFTHVATSTATSAIVSASIGSTYYFYVEAYDDGGASGPSNTASTALATLAAPANVTAAPANAAITLSWNAVDGADGYDVYSSTDDTNFTLLTGTAGLTATVPATLGVTYYYYIIAYNHGGFGPASATVSATTDSGPAISNAAIAPSTIAAGGQTITITASVVPTIAGSTVTSVVAPLSMNGSQVAVVQLSNGGSGTSYIGSYSAPFNISGASNVYTATINATDSLGATSTGSVARSTTQPTGTPPSIAASIGPSTLTAAGGAITVTATIVDAAGIASTSATVFANGGQPHGITLSNGGSGNTYTGTYNAPANAGASAVTYTATVSATDTLGLPSTQAATGSVIEETDSPPAITNASISPSTLTALGGNVTITATVTDATSGVSTVNATILQNNANFTTVVMSNGGSGSTYTGTFIAQQNSSNSAITYTANVNAVDGAGNSSTQAATGSTVQSADVAPVISNASISPSTLPATGGSITVSANVDDAGSGVDSVTATLLLGGSPTPISVTLNNTSGDAYSGTVNVGANTSSLAVTYTATVIAVDNVGNTTNVTAGGSTLQSGDGGPVVSKAQISPSSLTASGGTVTVSATVDDPNTLTSVVAQIQLDGANGSAIILSNGGSGDVYTGTYAVPANATPYVQTYSAIVTASDTAGLSMSLSTSGSCAVATNAGQPGELPNLEVTQSAVVNSAIEGQQIKVSYTVTNVGLGQTPNPWNDDVYLSQTPTLSPGAVLLGKFGDAQELAPGASYTQTENVTLPAGTFGPYYIVVSADGDSLLQESDESDNTMAQPIDISQVQNLLAAPSQLSTSILVGIPQNGSITLTNASNATVTGIAANVSDLPSNIQLTVTPPASLTANQSVTVPISVTASNPSTQTAKPVIQFTDAQGDSSNVDLSLTIVPPYPQLTVTPGSIKVGMVVGSQSSVQVTVTNTGGAAANNLIVTLPQVPWMSLASPQTIGTLAPGASATLQILLSPAQDLPLGLYTGAIAVNGDSVSALIDYSINAVTSATGTLKVTTSDEYTYFASTHPPLTGATVTLVSAVTGSNVLSGTTDANGTFTAPSITAGAYQITVTAPNHANYSNSIQITPGEETDVQAFLSADLVTYQWTVVPVQTADKYDITLQAVFQTNVPAPEITVSPAYIDLTKVQFDSTGKAVVLVTYTNHGLIAANDLNVAAPTPAGYIVQFPQQDLGSIAAQSSVVVPFTFIQAGSSAAQGLEVHAAALRAHDASGDDCNFTIDADVNYDCANIHIHRTVSVSVSTGNCPGLPAPNIPRYLGNGGSPTGGGPGGPGGPGVAVAYDGGPSAPSLVIPNLCNTCVNAILTDVGECIINFIPGGGCATSVAVNAAECGYSSLSGGAGAYDACLNNALSIAAKCAESLSGIGEAMNVISCANNALDLSDNCFGTHFFGGSGPGGGFFGPGGGTGGGLTLVARAAAKDASGSGSDAPTGLVQELGSLATETGRMEYEIDPVLVILGDTKWLSNTPQDEPKFASFMSAFSTIINDNGSNPITPDQQATLEGLPLPAQIGVSDVDTLVQRWNNTIANANAGIFNSTQVPSGGSTNFIASDILNNATQGAQAASSADAADGYTNLGDGVQSAEQNTYNYILNPDNEQSGTCATVKIQLDQQVTLTRTNFHATLDLTNAANNVPLSNVAVNIVVTDTSGNDVTSQFGISTPSTTVFGGGGVDGTGTLGLGQTGTAQWTIEPTEQAGANGTTKYYVGGSITYTQNGAQISIPIYPTGITVVPDPYLNFHYFLQRTVYGQDPTDLTEGIIDPIEPFYLGVLVDNVGKGTAHQLTITTDQPQIVDNEKGLAIDFQIIGTEVNLQPVSPSLMVNLGDIAPGGTSAAEFDMISSLAGTFTSFTATYKHIDDVGNTDTSLIDSVDTHLLNHIVRIVDPADDGKPDFLTTENANPQDLPDTVWDSNGSAETPVTSVTDAFADNMVSNNNLTVHVAYPDNPSGFMYLQMNDPGQGNYALQSVVRSDGKHILVGPNAWTTKEEVHPLTGGSTVEERFYIFDDNAAGDSYTVTYAPMVPQLSAISPVSIQAGSGSFTLTVDGTGFVSGATVILNGQSLTTTYQAATQLTAAVPASAIASSGNLSVTVVNPFAGSSPSNAIDLVVNPAPAKPAVSISSPVDGGTVIAPGGIMLTATAGETGGTITEVDFFVNGQWVSTGTPTGTPGVYTASIPSTVVGPYSLTATATDTLNQVSTSTPVNITAVAGGTTPAPSISGLEPPSVPAGSQQFTLTVNGANFNSNSLVDWAGQSLPTTFVSGSELTAVVASTFLQQASTANITVVNPAVSGGSSNNALFTVSANTLTPPAVTLTTPTGGSTFGTTDSIPLAATATAKTPGATITSVQFYAGTQLIGSSTIAPYTATASPLSAGSYSLTAVATDSDFSTSTSAPVNITVTAALAVQSLSFSPNSVLGGQSTRGTVTLTRAATSNTTITVTCSDSAVSIGTVVVKAGQTSVVFTVNTTSVSSTDTPLVTASYGGGSASATFTILPPESISALFFSPISVFGGTSSTGMVRLSYPALTAQTVSVTSADPAVSIVGPAVVAAGQTTGQFTVNTSTVTAVDTASIVATLGHSNKTGTLTIQPLESVKALSLSPGSVLGGTSTTAKVTVAYAAFADTPVTVTCTDPNVTIIGPIVVPAGKTTATFTINTVSVTALDQPVITATLGGVQATAQLSIYPPNAIASFTVSPGSVVGGNPATGTITMAYPALAKTQIHLTWSDANVTMSGNVNVNQGNTSVSFPIQTQPVTSTDSARLHASYNGFSQSTTLTLKP